MDDAGAAQTEEFESFDLKSLAERQRYNLIMGSVVPRAIALVSTVDAEGIVNVAPFSSLISLSSVSNLIGFSIASGPRGEKDTLRNIRRNGEFVINTVPEFLARQVQACAEAFAPGISEAEQVGLSLAPSVAIGTPRIANTNAQFECRLHSIVQFGEGHLVAGHVELMHMRKGVVSEYRVDIRKYAPIGRLGGRRYCKIETIIDV